MTYKTLIVKKEGAVDRVTLNRPDALNAMNPELVDELQDYFGRLYTDHSVRIVVLKGAGRAFCAGLDLKERSNRPDADATSGSPQSGLVAQRRISEIVMRMRRCPQAGP
jgi:enoyl-CoA hydratase